MTAELSDGRVLTLLPTGDSATLTAGNLTTQDKVLVHRCRGDGSVVGTLYVGQ